MLLRPVAVRAQAQNEIKIEGIVRDQDKHLVGGALVSAGVPGSNPTTTNPNGMFIISIKADPGTLVPLQITKSGYQGAFQPVAAVPGIPYFFVLVPVVSTRDTTTALAGTFDRVDVIYREVSAFRAGVKPIGLVQNSSFALKAVQHDSEIDFENNGATVTKITAADIQKLSAADQQYIIALERSMTNYFTTWTNLYPTRSDPSVTTDRLKEIDRRLQVAGLGMCDNLQHILLFLGQLNLMLQDHYMSIRNVCEQFQFANVPPMSAPSQ